MFSFIRRWQQRRIIQASVVTHEQWGKAFKQLPLLRGLSREEQQRLINLAIVFLHDKSLEGAQGLVIHQEMGLIIALQACLPILNLGLDWYDGWVSVIIYPTQFIPERNYVDEYGIEHRTNSVLSGESWQKGPVILSWEDSRLAGIIDGHNLVIHEFAHKLDALNGRTNGFPPLHRGMSVEQWSGALSEAFTDLQRRMDSGDAVPIDRYAATSPAEFFAVMSEVFFECPDILRHYYPQVYDQFKLFFKQNPLARLAVNSQ